MLYTDRIHRQIEALGNLPLPSDDAITHSENLYLHILRQLREAPLAFHDVMEQLLYAPGLGYYSAGSEKIGIAGDFTTAPETSELFGFSIAKQCMQVLENTGGDVLEFGAGIGTLACDVLRQLASDNCLPDHYYIIEISADLKQRQQQKLKTEIPELYSRVVWLDHLPKEGFKGIILANEVLDAMPIHLFEIHDGAPKEMQVYLDADDNLIMQRSNAESKCLNDWFKKEEISEIEFSEGYLSEVNLAMEGWIRALSECLSEGLILLIDYGYPRHEYYLPERNQGTLISHYRHHSHDEVLYLLGLQDVTAHVDFTAVAESASDAGLSVSGYTNQASFLSGCGILQMAEIVTDGDLNRQMRLAQKIRTLIMPDEMGEIFKVIALTKDLPHELSSQLIGFSFSDLRHSL